MADKVTPEERRLIDEYLRKTPRKDVVVQRGVSGLEPGSSGQTWRGRGWMRLGARKRNSERRKLLRELAAQGLDELQIARRMNIGIDRVRTMAREVAVTLRQAPSQQLKPGQHDRTIREMIAGGSAFTDIALETGMSDAGLAKALKRLKLKPTTTRRGGRRGKH